MLMNVVDALQKLAVTMLAGPRLARLQDTRNRFVAVATVASASIWDTSSMHTYDDVAVSVWLQYKLPFFVCLLVFFAFR